MIGKHVSQESLAGVMGPLRGIYLAPSQYARIMMRSIQTSANSSSTVLSDAQGIQLPPPESVLVLVYSRHRLYSPCHALRFNPHLNNGLGLISSRYFTNEEELIGLHRCSKPHCTWTWILDRLV
jgi:hypothetical protein